MKYGLEIKSKRDMGFHQEIKINKGKYNKMK